MELDHRKTRDADFDGGTVGILPRVMALNPGWVIPIGKFEFDCRLTKAAENLGPSEWFEIIRKCKNYKREN